MIIKKIWDYVNEYNMISAGDYVAAGISGGADSVCLLFALLEIRKKLPFALHAVHVNHMIRKEAAADAEYVRSLCKKLNVKFTLKECDVEAIAKKEGISTEEAGRNARYEAFGEVLREAGFGADGDGGKIAVAHNKNDCCETFLFNLFRGSSLRGLSGIAPVRGKAIRPLMCLERYEIEEFLDKNGIRYCIDHTNLEDNYTRNKIRHHVLSAAVGKINPASVAHIGEACVKIREAYSFISDAASDAYGICVKEDEKGIRIDGREYMALHPVMQDYVIMAAIENAAKSAKNIETAHVEQVKALFKKQCGRKISLPYKICASRDYSGVFLCKEKDIYESGGCALFESGGCALFESGGCAVCEDGGCALYEGMGDTGGEYALTDGDYGRLLNNESVEIGICSRKMLVLSIKNINFEENNVNIPKKKYTKWIDYDRIEKGIVIRTRKEGDYLTIDAPDGKVCRKKLKPYFTDKKIPAAKRGKICLVADGSHILWIAGDRMSSFYKVSGGTKRILELEIKTRDGGLKKWQNT